MGGGKKKTITLKKRILTNSYYFWGKLGNFFQFEQICVRKILNLYFRAIFNFWGQFSSRGNPKSLF